jgi:hypothetical protein
VTFCGLKGSATRRIWLFLSKQSREKKGNECSSWSTIQSFVDFMIAPANLSDVSGSWTAGTLKTGPRGGHHLHRGTTPSRDKISVWGHELALKRPLISVRIGRGRYPYTCNVTLPLTFTFLCWLWMPNSCLFPSGCALERCLTNVYYKLNEVPFSQAT